MYESIFLSLKLAAITTILLFLVCAPLALLLARSRSRIAQLILAVFSLPLVLPPTVLGFYLLVFLSPIGPISSLLNALNLKLVFNFQALVIASVVYSLPFMLNPLVSAISTMPQAIFERCWLQQKGFFTRLVFVILPSIKVSICSAVVMSFAHTMGEFGVVMMIGGSREGETKVASIAVFEALENLDYDTAHHISLVILLISLVILVLTQLIASAKKGRELV